MPPLPKGEASFRFLRIGRFWADMESTRTIYVVFSSKSGSMWASTPTIKTWFFGKHKTCPYNYNYTNLAQRRRYILFLNKKFDSPRGGGIPVSMENFL